MSSPWAYLALVGIAIAIFFSGRHSASAQCMAQLTSKDTAIAAALAVSNTQHQQEKDRYVSQAAAAKDQLALDDALLARLRSQPKPRLLCHTAPASGGGAMPSIPAAAGGGAPGAGALPQRPDFDPSERLYSEIADSCDVAIERFRYVLGLWPTAGPVR